MNSKRPLPAAAGRRLHQAGMTLMEVILGLSILAMVTVGLNQLADRWASDTKDTVTASQVRTFGEAVNSYIKDNYAAVQAAATAITPVIIDVPTLIATQKLTAGHQNSNAYGQSLCALVLEPTANRLQGMVVSEGGKAVGDPSLATIAAIVGGSGGGVYSTDTATIKGAVGGWNLAASSFDNLTNNLGKKCDGTPGNVRVEFGHPMMALWFENGDVSSAFVARDEVPGRPELNAMNTPLIMNSVQTRGAACAAGAIARAADGSLLTCRSGTWQPASSTCVGDSTTNLNNLQDDNWCVNGAGNPNSPAGADWFFLEVYRHVAHGIYYVAQRLIGMSGTSYGKVWIRNQQSGAQAGGWSSWNQVSDPGVQTANGTLTASTNVVANNNVTAAGQVTAGAYIWSGGDVYATATVNGNYIYSRGSVDATGNMNATGNVSGAYLVGRSGLRSYSSGDWGLVMGDSAGNLNSSPMASLGSAHVNDIFVRSVGKWASQLGGISGARFTIHDGESCAGGCQCPSGSVLVGMTGWWNTFTDVYTTCQWVN